mgnify:CR=1 FL=1
MTLIIQIIIFFVLIEFLFVKYLKFLRTGFQWLIIKKLDLNPKLSKNNIHKFYKNSFDKTLGWVPRSNSIKIDKIKSFGEQSKKKFPTVKYKINKYGERFNPSFEKKRKKIFTFGDSFVFARHVNDKDTWQHKLSSLTNSNVVNFGVGNYGIDQSILRMQKILKNKKNKIIILGFVPETIVRIHSCWRHFYEYGNFFAFKPRFILKNKSLKLIKNPISKITELYNLKKKINFLIKNDIWYNKKFKHDLIHFPFLLSIFKNFPKNMTLIYYLTISKIFQSYNYHNKAWRIILNDNSNFVYKSYYNKEMVNLMSEQIKYFSKTVKKGNGRPVVVIFPYLEDLRFISRKRKLFYSKIITNISKYVAIIDLTKSLLEKKNKNKYFVNSFYGSHLSKKGNKFCAEEIYNFFKKNKIV